MKPTYVFHAHGKAPMFGVGTRAEAAAYLRTLNEGRTVNLFVMRPAPGKPGRGFDIAAELRKLPARQRA